MKRETEISWLKFIRKLPKFANKAFALITETDKARPQEDAFVLIIAL